MDKKTANEMETGVEGLAFWVADKELELSYDKYAYIGIRV